MCALLQLNEAGLGFGFSASGFGARGWELHSFGDKGLWVQGFMDGGLMESCGVLILKFQALKVCRLEGFGDQRSGFQGAVLKARNSFDGHVSEDERPRHLGGWPVAHGL